MAGDPTQQNVVLTADTTQYQQSMDQSASKTQTLLTSVTALSTALGELTKRAGQRIELVGAGTATALAAATYQAANFQQQMSQLNAQAVMTNRSFDDMVRQTNNLRSSVGMSTGEIVNLVQQLNNLGQGNNNVERLATTFIKLGSVTGESITGLADGLISLQRQMGTTGADQTERYASALANLSANAGTSAQGILQFSNAIAPIGRVAGMTQNQIMGVATAFNKAGADGYGATTAFNKMLTDITRAVQYGSPELASYANLIGVSTDQFTKMSKSDAISKIFDQINNQGPAAIKTLERFGLDGTRTMKSIQAVAASGGMQQAIQQATEGYNNTDKFNEAAAKSMDTLNEAAQKLRNTLAQMAESFGEGLVAPVTAAIKAINLILSPLNSMLQMLGAIPGLATAAGAGLTVLAGAGIANMSKLLGIGTIAQFAQGFARRGLGAGLKMGNESLMNERTRNAFQSYQRGEGSLLQRWGYGAGARVGSAWTTQRSIQEMRAAEARAAAPAGGRQGMTWRTPFNAVIRGAGNMFGASVESMRPAVRENVFARQPVFGGGIASTLKPVDFQNIQLKEGTNVASQGFKDAGKEATEHARQMRNVNSVLKTTSTEMSNVARYAAQGYMGVGRTALGMAGTGMRAVAGSALGLVGGPIGAALMGGIGLYSAISNRNSNEQDNMDLVKNAGPMQAAGAAYRQALGEAAKATSNFADIVSKNTSQMIPNAGQNFSGQVDADMIKRYTQHANADYTDKNVGNMTDDQLKAYAQAAQMTPSDLELFGYDVLKRTGGDQKRTQAILDAAKNKGPMDVNNLFSGIAGKDVWGMGSATDESTQAAAAASGTLQQMVGAAQSHGDTQLANRTIVAAFNSALNQSRRPNSDEVNIDQIAGVLNKQLGGDDKSQAAIQHYLATSGGGTNADSWAGLQHRVQSGDATPQERMIWQALQGSGLTGNAQYGTTVPTAVQGNSAVLFSQIDGSVVNNARNSSAFGAYAFGANNRPDTDVGRAVDLAANNTGNADIQAQSAEKLAESAQSFSGSIEGGIDAMQKLKGAAINASDPLYQLANAAEQYLRQQQQLSMHYQTMPTNLATLQKQAATSYANSQAHPSEGATQQAQSDDMAFQQAKAGAFDRVMSISMAYRQLQLQQGYARSDYNLQRKRQETAFNLQNQYATTDQATQVGYAKADYATQTGYANEDFKRQRQRSDDSYYRQLARSQRDFDLQRSYAQADFTKSRLRQEADYQHQVQEMTKQTAKSVYDTYARVNVQRTWDAQNLLQNMADQQKRLDEQQANLAKVRQMGLSGDAINQLGLNDPNNAQQLSRMVDDLMADPKLVDSFNKSVADRLKAASKVVTDQDSEQWKEMQYQFKQNQDRALTDFNQSLDRQNKAYNTQLTDQRNERNIQIKNEQDDFDRQMSRSATAFNLQMSRNSDAFNLNLKRQKDAYNLSREQMATDFQTQIDRANQAFQDSATDMTDKIGALSKAALKALTGTAKDQFSTLLTYLDQAGVTMDQKLKAIATQVLSTASVIGNAMSTMSSSGTAGSSAAADRAVTDAQNAGGGDLSYITPGKPAITSPFGPRAGGFHHGVDLGVKVGTPVYSSMPGRVIYTGFQANGFGNHVRVQHAGGLYSIYGHMSKFSVAPGQSLAGGASLGASGNTGNTTGPHLHYEIRKGNAYDINAAVNPMPWLRRSSGGGVYGSQIGDRVPMLAEAGEYVMPKHRVKDMGWAFMDALRANGVAGVKNYLLAANSVPNTTATNNYYQRIDKGNHFTGDICVHASDPMEFARKMEAEQRMKALTGARR